MPITLNGDGAISGLTATGISAVQNLPAGSVLQVVQSESTTQVTVNNTTTFSSLSLSASITPKFTTSKILVILSVAVRATGAAIVGVKIQRGGSDIKTYGFVTHLNSNIAITSSNSMVYLDSPASTSSLTYSVLGNSNQASSTFQFSDGAGTQISSITLLEIAG